MTQRIEFIAIPGIPLISTGDDLSSIIVDSMARAGITLVDGDVLVVTSKIVSKAEGRWVCLDDVNPSESDQAIAELCEKDPREVSIIMGEANRVSRTRKNVLIVEHKLGFVCANAGVDHSNTREGNCWRLLLPSDPDRSAFELRQRLAEATGVTPGVVISDSHGRPFRLGTVGIAVGSSGIPALKDFRGSQDLFGVSLKVTETGFADEIASGAGLIQGQGGEGRPVVIVRGLNYTPDDAAKASDLVRPKELDLFR